ncbi:MAG: Thioredoxin [Deltaproteobacteria bacterium]|jgi:thiol:disulfide interchange protein|nr:Thioredoxin [Deltaproteobacteria bacterium]
MLNRFAFLGAVVAGLVLTITVAWAGVEDWNDANIRWMPYQEGLAAAKKNHRPICLIFYTTWCPHCANYAKVFSNPEVVKKAKSFVMIRLDKDKNQELSKQYKPDGEYIPRTFFLSSAGVLDESLTEERPQYKYFYSESDPASLLAGMDRALNKLR